MLKFSQADGVVRHNNNEKGNHNNNEKGKKRASQQSSCVCSIEFAVCLWTMYSLESFLSIRFVG